MFFVMLTREGGVLCQDRFWVWCFFFGGGVGFLFVWGFSLHRTCISLLATCTREKLQGASKREVALPPRQAQRSVAVLAAVTRSGHTPY